MKLRAQFVLLWSGYSETSSIFFFFMDFKKNMKIGLSQVEKMYIVCAILRNSLTCLYSKTTAAYFGLDPPTLNDYFN